jgi:thioredoxin 1
MIKVIKFSASWCNPCKILSQTLKDKDNIEEIDVEKNMEMAFKYNVRNVPTLVFLKNGVEVHRTVGLIQPKMYDSIITEINDAKELNDIEVIEPKFETGEE